MRERVQGQVQAWVKAGAAALVALAVTACGGSGSGGNGVAGKSPDAVVTQATRAIDGVHTVHVTGSIPDGTSSRPIRLDLSLVNGSGATGSMSEDGVSFRLVTVHGTAYIQGSPGFWRQFAGPAAATRLDGHWLRAPAASGRLASLNALTDVRSLLQALLSGHGPLTKGATSTLAGRRVIALHDTSKHGTLYVATTGPAYPIRIVATGSSGGQIDFGDFNAKVALTAPASSVAISTLGH